MMMGRSWTARSGGRPRDATDFPGLLFSFISSRILSFQRCSSSERLQRRPDMAPDSLLTPYFPPLRPDTLYSFYPYPIIARHRTNHSLLNPRSPHAAEPGADPAADLVPVVRESGKSDAETLLDHLGEAAVRDVTASPVSTPFGPGPWPAQATVETKAQQKKVLERAQRRALHLQNPCGVGLHLNEDKLTYAELNLFDDHVSRV